MTEPLGAFLEHLEQSGQVVPFELVLRHRREQEVASLPVPEAAPARRSAPAEPPPPRLMPPRPPPLAPGGPAPQSLVPGLAADPRILYGSFANPSPPPGSVLRYLDVDNFGWAPASAGVVAVATPASGATVAMVGDILYVNNAAELPALTIRLPSGPVPGQMAEVGFAHPVTVLSVRDAAGSAVEGAPAEAYGPGNALQFRYIEDGWVFWK